MDSNNRTIRKLTLTTGAITTIAGDSHNIADTVDGVGSDARFYGPSTIASDGAGTLYIADSLACTIRKLVIATGLVTTIAGSPRTVGNSDGRFGGAGALAYDGAGVLYVADLGTVRKLVLATAEVSTPIGVDGKLGVNLGPLPARLNRPLGLAVAPPHTLVIVDGAENAVLTAPLP